VIRGEAGQQSASSTQSPAAGDQTENPPSEGKITENGVFSRQLFLVLRNKKLFLSFIHVNFLRQ
jgi:hypothetical protein